MGARKRIVEELTNTSGSRKSKSVGFLLDSEEWDSFCERNVAFIC